MQAELAPQEWLAASADMDRKKGRQSLVEQARAVDIGNTTSLSKYHTSSYAQITKEKRAEMQLIRANAAEKKRKDDKEYVAKLKMDRRQICGKRIYRKHYTLLSATGLKITDAVIQSFHETLTEHRLDIYNGRIATEQLLEVQERETYHISNAEIIMATVDHTIVCARFPCLNINNRRKAAFMAWRKHIIARLTQRRLYIGRLNKELKPYKPRAKGATSP